MKYGKLAITLVAFFMVAFIVTAATNPSIFRDGSGNVVVQIGGNDGIVYATGDITTEKNLTVNGCIKDSSGDCKILFE